MAIRSVVRAPSLGITDGSHYVRAAAFSPSGDLLAFASTDGRMQLYRWPSREPVWRSEEGVFSRGDEVCDVDFSADGRQVAFTTPNKLVVLATSPRQVPGRSPYRVLQTIRDPTVGADQRASLRAAKFGRGSDDHAASGSQDLLYTLVNAPTSGRSKGRESYITVWNADTWEMLSTRKVSTRPATVLAVSPDGLLLACASSDLSITVLQALTLKPVLRVVNTHDFPPTCLAFSPNSRNLVSGSADSTIRVMDVPPALAAGTSRMYLLVADRANQQAWAPWSTLFSACSSSSSPSTLLTGTRRAKGADRAAFRSCAAQCALRIPAVPCLPKSFLIVCITQAVFSIYARIQRLVGRKHLLGLLGGFRARRCV